MNYKIVLISIIHRKNFQELLLVKRKREPEIGKWSLSGGYGALEKEKDPLKAINLELQQDFQTKFNGKFYTIQYKNQKEPTLCLYFVGELEGEPKVPEKTKSIQEIRWFSTEKVLKMDLAFGNKDKEIIKKLKKDFS